MSGKRELTTRGIVVGRRSAGDGSVRVFLYSEALGLVSAIAKSAREERSQLRSHLQWGTYGNFMLVLGKETWRVKGVSHTANIFFELGERAAAKEAAARVLETVRQFIHGEEANPELFAAMWQLLQASVNASKFLMNASLFFCCISVSRLSRLFAIIAGMILGSGSVIVNGFLKPVFIME